MDLASSIATYGADMSGLICGFRFTPGQPGQPVSGEEVLRGLQHARALAAEAAEAALAAAARQNADLATPDCAPVQPEPSPADDGAFYWLHFNLAHAASASWMRSHLDLPDGFFEMLVEGSHSTRIEHMDGALFAVVNDVMFDFELTPSQIATLWSYTHERLLVTARMKPLRSIDRLRGDVRNGETFRSPAELLIHLMRDQADLMVEIVRRTSIDVDRAEDQFLASRRSKSRHELAAMRRILVRLQRMLAPEPGSIFRLLARPPRWLQSPDVQDLREATEEFSLVLGDMAGLVERIKLLQEEIAARLEEQNNRTLFTLTLVTVLALPINIVAGFFGMNVGGIPLAENRHGFWLMVLVVASFTALLGWWVFRRRGDS
ncbi:transporter [Paraburkholderia tropica]|uniref:Zinc transporter n=1 Tax=Paraburkholderia tropica TaxID=92647 RepID=A0A1A5X4F4_9BURK|nr:transporter [Paraburkholderia tropica]MBB2983476.1 zinc transporter [Paraburkholderia tropica]MBB3001100.1 zinc transporter [Paraburkholderia tropica]MBB6320732.1 zinc transporter [Paraburkholderia tropica]OBR48466.1 magnesium transporter CorA [Paraburkholderia tropica]PXX19028.1 zinc transporter [Paraburkholderia tropica]